MNRAARVKRIFGVDASARGIAAPAHFPDSTAMNRPLAYALTAALFTACSTPPSPDASLPDALAGDAASDAAPRTIAELPVESSQTLAGLDGDVDVVVDRFGWPHIYATTLRDAMY